jgi:hypothetical protein
VADYTPVYAAGQRPLSKTTSAAVTGGTVVMASGAGTVAMAGAAAANVVGVAAHDAASGARITVWPLAGVEHEIITPAGITAGGGVSTAANGQVDPVTTSIAAGSAAGTLIGIATTTATAGNKVRFVGRT